jgi:hypothetical protein
MAIAGEMVVSWRAAKRTLDQFMMVPPTTETQNSKLRPRTHDRPLLFDDGALSDVSSATDCSRPEVLVAVDRTRGVRTVALPFDELEGSATWRDKSTEPNPPTVIPQLSGTITGTESDPFTLDR